MSLRVINKQGNKALILNNETGKSFPVTMQKWLQYLVCIGDLAIVERSPVSGEWYLTDYVRYIDNEVEA